MKAYTRESPEFHYTMKQLAGLEPTEYETSLHYSVELYTLPNGDTVSLHYAISNPEDKLPDIITYRGNNNSSVK